MDELSDVLRPSNQAGRGFIENLWLRLSGRFDILLLGAMREVYLS
jgi:hypothetical protein